MSSTLYHTCLGAQSDIHFFFHSSKDYTAVNGGQKCLLERQDLLDSANRSAGISEESQKTTVKSVSVVACKEPAVMRR